MHKKLLVLFLIFLSIASLALFLMPLNARQDRAAKFFQRRYFYRSTLPDFVIKDVAYRTSERGDYFEVTVCNDGAAAEKAVVNVWLVVGGKGYFTNVFKELSSFPAHACEPAYRYFTIDAPPEAGEYDLVAYADRAPYEHVYYDCSRCLPGMVEMIAESNEDNNRFSKRISINPQPQPFFVDEYANTNCITQDQWFPIMNIARNEKLEKEVYQKYVVSIRTAYPFITDDASAAITHYIAYGFHDNHVKIGAGERAAVVHSFYESLGMRALRLGCWEAFGKIAHDKNPKVLGDSLLLDEARGAFAAIYGRDPRSDDMGDRYVIDIMAYGVRQRGEKRSLAKEASNLKRFRDIFGHLPESTFDWNVLQAVTYAD